MVINESHVICSNNMFGRFEVSVVLGSKMLHSIHCEIVDHVWKVLCSSKVSVPVYQCTWCTDPTELWIFNPRWLWPQCNLKVTTHLLMSLKCTTVMTTNSSVFVYDFLQQVLDNEPKYVSYSLSHCCCIDCRTLAVSTVPWVLGLLPSIWDYIL